jgi:2-haloacid dehalogenase
MMAIRPVVIAFDVIGTLFALEPLADRLQAVSLPPDSLRVFFAGMLRDAFALEASGTYRPLLDGFVELPAHSDVRPAFERLRSAGIRIITLTNSAAESIKDLLSRASILDFVERTISIDDIGHWEPYRDVYFHAARAGGVNPSRLGLVAAHAWDTHGAKQAGLVTGWVQRQDKEVLSVFSAPDVRGTTLIEVVDQLLTLPEG